MKRSLAILFFVLTLALVQLACSLPAATRPSDRPLSTVAPEAVSTATASPDPSPTNTQSVPTATGTVKSPSTSNTDHGDEACTYRATFLGDATIPDDSFVAAGSMFVKTWMVRNDGTCTWGPDKYAHFLYALAFAGGSQMGAPSVIPLHDAVRPGQTTDVSVTLVAPTAPGTYTSNWMFRVEGDPNGVGPNVGVGPYGNQPLSARIRVGDGLTRLQFQPGTTTAIVTGELEPNETRGYLVAAQQGQVMVAGIPLIEQQGGVRAKITTRDHVALPNISSNTDVVVSLATTQDYIVWVSAGDSTTPYHLAVTIPVRIAFAPGSVSARLEGSISLARENWYVLRASAGQTLTASLDRSNVGLIIAGLQDSQVLGGVGSEDIVTSWTGTLPTTQDYIIKVSPVVDSTLYTLDVTVE